MAACAGLGIAVGLTIGRHGVSAVTAATRASADALFVDAQRTVAEAALVRWRVWTTTQGLRVYYTPGDGAQAGIVVGALQHFYPEVMADFGLPQGGAWPVVVCSPAQMVRLVGGPADDPPLGAYYRGVVWLLAPSAVVGPAATVASYERLGPVAHELTHLAEGLIAGGRVPAWLNEGIAQYEDWRLSGYVWVSGANRFDQATYSWDELTSGNFYALPNQALAYRQALAVTAVICREGQGACGRLLRALRAGEAAPQAIATITGMRELRALAAGAAWKAGSGPLPGEVAGPVP